MVQFEEAQIVFLCLAHFSETKFGAKISYLRTRFCSALIGCGPVYQIS